MYDGNSQFDNIFLQIAKNAESRSERNVDDYVAKDGLLYCGKCHTQKQFVMEHNGKKMAMPIMCKCKKEEEQRYEQGKSEAKRIERIDYLKRTSMIDERYKSSSFDDIEETPDNRRPLKICKRYVEKFDELFERNQGLLLYGDKGTGKTLFSCCIANELLNRGTSVLEASVPKLIRSMESTAGERKYYDKASSARLLILDDLGAERDTSYALETVYNIVDSRYVSNKPMIVTTNLSLEQMKKEQNEKCGRIYDRILEVCYPVKFTGKSWRLKEAAARFSEMKKALEE